MKFSQRIGKVPVINSLQKDGMDDALRTGLWNGIHVCFMVPIQGERDWSVWAPFFQRMWHLFFKLPIDNVSTSDAGRNIDRIRTSYFKMEWHEAYDFVEYLVQEKPVIDRYGRNVVPSGDFSDFCNSVLEREMSAYRIVGRQIMAITDDQEILAIESAIMNKDKWSAASDHLRVSAELLFDRKTPSYSNSVKESISAVESACRVITNQPQATLGQALKEIEKKHALHTALKSAFSALYGYTSDADGIRHGGIDIAKVSFEEAKYMLVSCSAFVNYLKVISSGVSK